MQFKWGVETHGPLLEKEVRCFCTYFTACCGQHVRLDDAAEFIHRIVMVHLFRNWKISGHNVISYVRSILSQRWVGGPLCIFHTSKRPPTPPLL